ncbi:MAG TPA: glycosyltransferase [Candidatus Saccharimonadales bacterium]|nr:glycosyltransferase [Candidatus Saccharimonadales bacterium]
MKRREKIAAIIPCFNEAQSIGKVIKRFPFSQLQEQNLDLAIYVIDNNSTDKTARAAKKAGAIVLHEPEKGKGNALQTGFRAVPADVDYVVMLDGDNTYDPAEILRMVEPLRTGFCDVVIGSRLGGHIEATAMNPLNRLGNWFFTAGARTLYGANVTDVLTGYFAWKKPALDALRPHIASSGFAIEMEMITKMARLGHRIASVPISYDPRLGESNLRPFADGSRILMMLIKNTRWKPKPQAPGGGVFVPLRIVFVSDAVYPYMKGGKEKRLHEITKALVAMGHEVHIYTMHWWKSAEKTRTEAGVHLHAISKRYQMYSKDRRTIKEGVMFGLACLKLVRVRFDVLDVDHMPFFPVISAWLVCLVRRRKLYATWHESLSGKEWVDYMGTGGLIAAGIERVCTKLPYCITAASAHTRELLASTHGRTHRVGLVASGIDVSRLEAVEPAQAGYDVLYAGRLVKDKNVDKLVLAMERVCRERPETRCLIIGSGPERARLEKLASKRGLGEAVSFSDPLPDAADVYAHMKAAKVFCTPSVREGFGITALESLACGTPVVAIDSPANAARHLVRDGVNGSVVPLEPGRIAGALLRWIAAAHKTDILPAADEYDWRHLARKQVEIYTS